MKTGNVSSVRTINLFSSVKPFYELIKPRICFLSLFMVLLGYFCGHPIFDTYRLLGVLLGAFLLGASSNALNQVLEWQTDLKMNRTRNRPIPSGRLSLKDAVTFGVITGVFGMLVLLITQTVLVAVLGAFIFFFYIGLYTPSKMVSPTSTLIGAIPGALPPLLGNVSSHGHVTLEGGVIFGILFLWQIPHFLAIAWLYRKDYSAAGMPILPNLSPVETSRLTLLYGLALLPLTLVPTLLGFAGTLYFVGAFLLGILFLVFSFRFSTNMNDNTARNLFVYSVIYLPLISFLILFA